MTSPSFSKRPLKKAVAAIKSISKKGNGLGTYELPDGALREIEVPFLAPGDVAEVALYPRSKGVRQGKILSLLQPSIERIEPKCRHFADCGGCRLQHISYEMQVGWKHSFVQKCFSDIDLDGAVFEPILTCPAPWEYRNKMEFTFTQNREGEKFCGLMLEGGRGRVLNLQECHLVHPWMAEALKVVRSWWGNNELLAYYPPKDKGSLRTLTLREGFHSGDRLVILTVSGNPEFSLTRAQLDSFVAAVSQNLMPQKEGGKLGIMLRIHQAQKGQPTQVFEMHLYGTDHIRETLFLNPENNASSLKIDFKVSANAFFQPNPLQAEKLFSKAVQMAGISKDSVVYDLYCGTGTLGLIAAHIAKQVVGIEIVPEAVIDANVNVALNGIDNFIVLEGSVKKVLEKIRLEKRFLDPDLVCLDPPRAGLDDEAIQEVLKLSAKKILYVSCNPSTQAENCKAFIDSGYKIVHICPVDQFPHTPHIENIVLLVR